MKRQAQGGESVLSADAVRTIRDLRGLGVAWSQVAAVVRQPEAICRRAIGMPELSPPDPPAVLPWHVAGGAGHE